MNRLHAAVLAVLMVTMALPGVAATHNSRGASVHVVQPDEVADDGTLTPDVPPGEQEIAFHADLPQPRQAPPDQSGARYDPDRCTPADEVGGDYEQALRDGAACYVGYLDAQLEYVLLRGPLSPQFPSDKLYAYNPPPGETYCTGQDEPQDHTGPSLDDGGPADRTVASAERSATDGRCSGSGHAVFRTDEVAVDVNLLEAAVPADPDRPEDGAGTSTSMTLPLLASEYVFLFGQPHPDTEQPSPFRAGEGVFSGDPAKGSTPLTNLEGACGDRTRDCRLLTPEDLERYDREDPPGTTGNARLCAFDPAGSLDVDQRTSDGRCGARGRPVNAFFPDTTQGGLGLSGAPPTWATTLPGWHSTGLVQLHEAHAGATAAAQSYRAEEPRVREGTPLVYAVNPSVPTPGHPLECVRPGILAAGDDTVLGVDDPGVYGAYRADAIDVDRYTHPTRDQQATLGDATHDTVRPGVAAAETLATDLAAPGEALEAAGAPPAAIEAADRATYTEGQPEEPHAQPGPDNQRPFTREIGPGLVCDGSGTLRALDTAASIPGGLHVDAVVHGTPGGEDLVESYGLVDQGVPDPAPKDPSATDDGQPARESDTDKGGWAPRTYSFQAHTEARLDANGDGTFEGNCLTATSAEAREEPQDACVWTGIWDAYNPRCQARDGTPCDRILADRGYDVDGEGAGVGLYFVLRVTGPTLVTPWTNLFFHESCCIGPDYADKTTVLGDEQPARQNCLVGVSIGFADKLREHHGEDLLDALCEGSDGERVLMTNAMFRQFGPDSPPANAKVQWTPLTPRPAAVEDAGGLGEGDRLCMHAVWNVQPGVTAADTQGNIELTGGADGQRYTFSDCDPLAGGGSSPLG